MKKVFLFCSFTILLNAAFAQKAKVNSAWNYLKYEEFDKAKAAIDEASTDESSIGLWKTWYYRGLIYQEIHEKNKDKELNAPNALNTAFEAYKKSLEIDSKHDYAEEVIKARMPQIMQTFADSAMAQYTRKDFGNAYENFKTRMNIYYAIKKYVPTMPIDTNATYNAALLADKAGKETESVQYYSQLTAMNYKDAFATLAYKYCKAKDTSKAISSLDAGYKAFPNDINIIYAFINIYSASGKFDKAADKINDAIKLTPNNEMLYVVKGGLLEHQGKDKEAEDEYNKALGLNPNNFDVLKSIGLNIYNQGVKVNKQANEIPAEKQVEYDALIKKRNELLEKSLTYLDKANQIKAGDEEVERPMMRVKGLLKK